MDIYDWYDLDSIRNNMSNDYVQKRDLTPDVAGYDDVASSNANGGSGWNPIDGTFSGSLDGNGYTIEGLFIERFDTTGVGLFGTIDTPDEDRLIFKNIHFKDADISGAPRTGTLAGEINPTGTHLQISNVKAESSQIYGNAPAGGLVGLSLGAEIEKSRAVGGNLDVYDGSDTFDGGGGIVGAIDADITNCYSVISVKPSYSGIGGGIAGTMVADSYKIENCYNLGTVRTEDGVAAGICGSNAGTITDVYSMYSIYSTGSNQYGISGDSITTLTNHYYEDDISGPDQPNGDETKALPSSDMVGDSAETSMSDLDFANDWETVDDSDEDANGNGTPILQSLPRDEQLNWGKAELVTRFTVVSAEPNSVTDTEIEFKGEITELFNIDEGEVGFDYRVKGNDTYKRVNLGTFSSKGIFTYTLDGLDSDTDYEYRAIGFKPS